MAVTGESIGHSAAALEDWFIKHASNVEQGMHDFAAIADRPYFNRTFGQAVRHGFKGTAGHLWREASVATGFGYFQGLRNRARGRKTGFARHRSILTGRRTMRPWGLRMNLRTLAGMGLASLGPGFALWEGMEAEEGFAVGTAMATARYGTFMAGGRLGAQLGAWGARAGYRAAGAGLKKVGLGTIARAHAAYFGTRVVPSLLGGPIGWLAGAMLLSDAASWAVGFALHKLPTFASQFRADIDRSGYGGDYLDSAGAATMRQASLQAMRKSHVNARSALGQEGALLHV